MRVDVFFAERGQLSNNFVVGIHMRSHVAKRWHNFKYLIDWPEVLQFLAIKYPDAQLLVATYVNLYLSMAKFYWDSCVFFLSG